jgi:glycosyltransferase involved in cell wall biosynthesis
MSPVYAGLDVVVIPSLSEGLPNVLLEALFHGKPVVATSVGAVPDVLAGDLGRWLVPPGDVEALRGAILSAVRDEPGRDLMARCGRDLIRERFSPERRVEQIVAVYDTLRKNGRPARNGWGRGETP